MTNFEFFRKHNLKWLYTLWLPTIELLEKKDFYLERNPEAWGYYDSETNKITLLKEHDCWAIRVHEYGHWLNARLYLFLDALWEFPWWGLGLRALFDKNGNITRKKQKEDR